MSKAKNIVLLEGVHQSGSSFLINEGYGVEERKESLDSLLLIEHLNQKKAAGLGIRSKTQVTSEVLEACSSLEVLGTFCIGTNQVDLDFAAQKGIPVFNAPYSNTRSVAELVLAEIIVLSRKLGDLSKQVHLGQWNKKAQGSYEVRGKTLGVVGYGHIGTQVGILAEALGMNVIYYDILPKLPLGNAKPKETLKDLMSESHFVSFHVPETELTKNMITQKEISWMQPQSYLINASRGSVVDHKHLAEALKSGHLSGAAVDVYPKEPRKNGPGFESELLGLENVILTPHIGGSTEEAQKAIGEEVSLSLHKYFSLGDTMSAVNFPKISPPPLAEKTVRLTHIHQNKPGVLSQVNSLLSEHGLNISYQSLATEGDIGYLVVDFVGEPNLQEALKEELKQKDFTIRLRFLES